MKPKQNDISVLKWCRVIGVITIKKTPPEVEKIVIDLYTLKSLPLATVSSEMTKLGYSISPVTCKNILDRNGVALRTRGGIPALPYQQIAKDYAVKGTTLAELSEKYGVCVNTVKNAIKKVGNYIPNRHSNLDLNSQYFKVIDTEAKAYILGYLIADGNVYRNQTRSTLRIMVKANDVSICNLMKKELNADNALVFSKRKNGQEVSFSVESRALCLDLEKYGVMPAKTGHTYLPHLSADMMPHLIRGIFDGDGWISRFRRRRKRTDSFGFGICGDRQLVEDIHDYLTQQLDIYNVKVNHRKTWSSVLWGNQKDLLKIRQFLYTDAHYFLERKKDIFDTL